MWEGTVTFQEPRDHKIRQVPIRMQCGLVVFRDHHSCKATSPHLRTAERQFFGEEVVQLSKPRCELRTQICLHEFSRLIICRVLQFFLWPSFFIFDFSFTSVPIPEGKKVKCREEKKRFCEWASIRVVEGYQLIYNEITSTKLVLEQRHSRLSKTGAEDGAIVLKEISQRSNMLRRFRWRHKFVQNDGHHLPVMDQHGIFTDFYKIVENWIMFLVFPLRWRYDLEAYYLLYRVEDTVPHSTKMSDYPSIVFETSMLGEAQFDIPTSNPHWIRGNTLASKLEEKNFKIDPTYTSKRGRGL
jgi:hypothetical protein